MFNIHHPSGGGGVECMRSFIALMMEAVCTPETSVYFKATQHYIAESCHLYLYEISISVNVTTQKI
jgi:hypothetical protein